jgi:hypothetical protein
VVQHVISNTILRLSIGDCGSAVLLSRNIDSYLTFFEHSAAMTEIIAMRRVFQNSSIPPPPFGSVLFYSHDTVFLMQGFSST